jgi:hypothetical protein
MKTLLLICIVSMGFSINCSKANEQGINIEGMWGIIDLSYVTPDGTKKVMEDDIKNGTAVSDFFFMNNGKFKQTSNMSGSGTLDTYEGIWKIKGNNLIVTLKFEGQLIDVDYTCEMKNEQLVLTRTSPDGKMSIVNTFKKK